MNKTLGALFLFIAASVLCIILPLMMKQREVDFIEETQAKYEAEYLAWSIQNYRRINHTVLPSADLEFYCYDKHFNLIATLSSMEEYDFTPYFCVMFTHKGQKVGVSFE